jgi:hypothetical protein
LAFSSTKLIERWSFQGGKVNRSAAGSRDRDRRFGGFVNLLLTFP